MKDNDVKEETTAPVKSSNLFDILPFDITTNIIALLPQDTRVECLQVSRLWRDHILSCANG